MAELLKKQTNKHYGDMGEQTAAAFLKRRGWRILSRNYRIVGGELDIIAYRLGVLCFVEVKTRSSDEYGAPALSVDNDKLFFMSRASAHFLKTYAMGGRIPVGERMCKIRKTRNDVIEIYMTRNGVVKKISHLKNYGNGEAL